MAIATGPVSYEPSTLATGAEVRVDGGRQEEKPHANGLQPQRTRRRPGEFDDHFSQASFFWNSVGPVERDHIMCAFQHELAQVRVPAIRQRVVDNLAHVDSRLARKVAELVGAAPPDAKAAAGQAGFRDVRLKLPLEQSAALSMENGNGNGHGIATLRVAVLVAPGVEIGALRALQQALEEGHARCTLLAERIGSVATATGQQLAVDEALCSSASVLFDAVVVPGGAACVDTLLANGHAVHFVHEAFKHGKTVCVIGDALRLLKPLGFADAQAAAAVPGLIVGRNDPPSRPQLAQDFVAALAKHRHWGRAHVERIAA